MGLNHNQMVDPVTDCAYLFPGQGAQYVGMGVSLHDKYPAARDTFHQANQILGFDLAKLCFEGPKEKLDSTQYSQAAIFVTSIAALRAFEKELSEKFTVKFTAGLSLGEYTALCASGAISFEDGVSIVRSRGIFMEEASKENPGKMACVIGLERDKVEEVCKASGAQLANLNCPGQIVISGSVKEIGKAEAAAQKIGARKFVILDVGGAFHSSYMASAAEKLKAELDKMQIHTPKIPVVSNLTASFSDSPHAIKENLVNQLTHSTLWEDSMRFLISFGIKEFVEIGPGKVLKGLLKRIDSAVTCTNIE